MQVRLVALSFRESTAGPAAPPLSIQNDSDLAQGLTGRSAAGWTCGKPSVV